MPLLLAVIDVSELTALQAAQYEASKPICCDIRGDTYKPYRIRLQGEQDYTRVHYDIFCNTDFRRRLTLLRSSFV